MDKSTMNNRVQSLFLGLVGIAAIVLFWQLSVSFTSIGRVIPPPLDVLQSFFTYSIKPMGKYTIIQHSLFSLSRVSVGFGLSGLCGLILGIGMGYSKNINAIFSPIFNLIKPIPGLAWIPMAILWFGIGEVAKYFIIFMGGFAHVVVNTMDGTRRVDNTLIGAARMLGANRWQLFFYIVIPSSVPYIFAGLQISLSTSWMAVLAAEMVSSQEGSGWIIITGMNNGNTVQVLVGMISIGIVGLMLATLMRIIERKLCSWTIRGR